MTMNRMMKKTTPLDKPAAKGTTNDVSVVPEGLDAEAEPVFAPVAMRIQDGD